MSKLLSFSLAVAVVTGVVNAQTPTCPAPFPLQTQWLYEAPPKNAPGDFGAPNVKQGKTPYGQPRHVAPAGPKKIRNLILTIPDGFGPASEVLARNFVQWNNTQNNWNKQLASDTIQLGSVRTRSSDSFVTDSSASATAYSCAIKTFNGGVALNENGEPCGTVLEAAAAAGYKTGLVVTSRITHATPASFASHIYNRDDESKIAPQLVGDTPLGPIVDVLLGGGLGFFLPNTTKGSTRTDDRDVFAYAAKNGYHVITDRAGFDNDLKAGESQQAAKPYIGLFTTGHMSYNIDRDPTKEPSLLEMTKTALRSLERMTKGSDKGFFIMVEASRVDHAGHGNDVVAHLHEIIQYNEVVEYLKSYVDNDRDGETILIGTADHECAGLTLGGIVTKSGEYQYQPSALAAAYHSSSFIGSLWNKYNGSDSDAYLTSLFAMYGVQDANATEIATAYSQKSSASALEISFGQTMNRRAMIKWASTGHTAVDVNLIGYAPKAQSNLDSLRGNHDNTEIGLFINNQLGLNLPDITEKLNNKSNEKWLVDIVGRDKVEGGVRNLAKRDHIHHHH